MATPSYDGPGYLGVRVKASGLLVTSVYPDQALGLTRLVLDRFAFMMLSLG